MTILTAAALLAAVSCQNKIDPEDRKLTKEEREERLAINTFGAGMMGTYYLWADEIAADIQEWRTDDDPIEKVHAIRYKDRSGRDIDRWTVMTDDINGLIDSSNGVTTTYGMDFKLYYADSSKSAVLIVVTVVYPGSPAAAAGIRRGDIFSKVNGESLTEKNYKDLLYDGFLYAASSSLTDIQGGVHTLRAVEMYEEPVLVDKVLDIDGHKTGYLFYNRFTLRSISDLAEVGRRFRAEGIESLILDMRYNPGGYVVTETALGSLIAPEAEVRAGSVFQTNVYNTILTEAWGKDETRFATEVTYEDGGKEVTVNLSDANFGVSKVYAILTEDSASAAEGVLVGLMPYMDVRIIGKQSHGKYCSGIMYSAKDWYSAYSEILEDDKVKEAGAKYARDWGIYIMIGRYADKNGGTPCMPDGFKPDFETDDLPNYPAALGDPEEAMLKETIAYIKGKTATKASAPAADILKMVPDQPRDPMFGARILLPENISLLH